MASWAGSRANITRMSFYNHILSSRMCKWFDTLQVDLRLVSRKHLSTLILAITPSGRVDGADALTIVSYNQQYQLRPKYVW